ncbi:MAG: DUF5665 domain-containing protein [Candidatus Paceibacterota bacterium]
MPKKSSSGDKLTKSIRSLKQSIDRMNSLRWRFLLGVVQGIGVVVGASVLAGLVLGWLASSFETVSSIPFIGEYFADISDMLKNTDSNPAN